MTRDCFLLAASALAVSLWTPALAAEKRSPTDCGFASKTAAAPAAPTPDKNGFYTLFDGKSFTGWKVSENTKSFTIKDGAMVAHGPRAHAFYAGPVKKHVFKNFIYRIDVKTAKGSNGGLYIHTKWQPKGWPKYGYEIQVNNTHKDPRKTASIYGVQDIRKAPAQDDKWFAVQITVRGKTIRIDVDGKKVNEYTEPASPKTPKGWDNRRLSAGTFALQGHDPKSVVQYKNIRVKPLAD